MFCGLCGLPSGARFYPSPFVVQICLPSCPLAAPPPYLPSPQPLDHLASRPRSHTPAVPSHQPTTAPTHHNVTAQSQHRTPPTPHQNTYVTTYLSRHLAITLKLLCPNTRTSHRSSIVPLLHRTAATRCTIATTTSTTPTEPPPRPPPPLSRRRHSYHHD